MNVMLFELKDRLKSAVICTIALTAVLAVFMAGFFPVFAESLGAVKKILESFPREFTEAFGLEITSMFSYEGFFSFGQMYFSTFGAIVAVSLTVSVFAREKRSKCLEFILSKPRSRKKIFAYKLSAVLIILVVMNAVFVAVSMALYYSNGGADRNFFLASCSLFFTQMIFVAIGVFVSVFSKRIRSVAGTAAGFGFGAFILSALSSILEDKSMYYYAPLKFFDPSKLLFEGSYEVKFAVWAVFIIIVLFAVSFFKFTKSDAHAV